MASKSWRLVVTELGGDNALHEVTVDAGNWMSALTAGRSEIGEHGGVPTGASCAVAPDGKVTIHDPIARRTYVLTPNTEKSLKPAPAPTPKVPADAAPKAEARVSKKTMAYQAVVPPAAPAPAAPTTEAAEPEPAPVASQPAPQPTTQPTPKSSIPPPPEAETGDGWALLSRRDEEPKPDSPLRYCERTYVVPRGTDSDTAEYVLRERFANIRAALESAPPGKFFNLAVFDHEWTGQPSRPPLATLQWKDWKGEPILTAPPQPEAAPRASAPAAAQPAAPPPSTPAPQPTPAPSPTTPEASAPPPPSPQPAQASAPPAAQPSSPSPQPSSPSPQPSAPAPQPSAPAPQPGPGAAAPAPGAPRARKRTTTDEQDARLAQAFEASQDLFFLSNPVEGLEFVVNLMGELVPAEAMSACLYDINADEFLFAVVSGPGADERKTEAVPGRTGLLGAATELVGTALVIGDVSADTRFDPGVDGRVGVEVKNLMYVPLHHQGRLFGILQLMNRSNRDTFTPADVNLATYVGKQTAEFLYQMRLAPDSARAG